MTVSVIRYESDRDMMANIATDLTGLTYLGALVNGTLFYIFADDGS
jgi:hypothetical protein